MQVAESTLRSQTGTFHYVYHSFSARVAHGWNRRLRTWHHPLLVPAYVATVSAVILLLQVSLSSPLVRKYARRHTLPVALDETPEILSAPGLEPTAASVNRHIAELGGSAIFWMNVTRALAVFVLWVISIASFSVEGPKLALSVTSVCALRTFLAKSRLISRDSVLCFGVGPSCCIEPGEMEPRDYASSEYSSADFIFRYGLP